MRNKFFLKKILIVFSSPRLNSWHVTWYLKGLNFATIKFCRNKISWFREWNIKFNFSISWELNFANGQFSIKYYKTKKKDNLETFPTTSPGFLPLSIDFDGELRFETFPYFPCILNSVQTKEKTRFRENKIWTFWVFQ